MRNTDPVVTELQKARIKLLMDWPIFGPIITLLELKEVDWCSTAATDGRYFFYNREFIKKLDRAQLLFLTAHEVLHCFPEGTIIPGEFKPIEDYMIGEHVVGENGGHSKVVSPMSRHYNGDMITIKGRGLLPIKMTPEHPVLVRNFKWVENFVDGRRGNIRKWSEPQWKLAGEVQPDDWLHLPRIVGEFSNYKMRFEFKNAWSVHDKLKNGVSLDAEVAEFLGWYVAEGCTSEWQKNYKSTISLNINELRSAERLKEILFNRFGVSSSIKIENSTCRLHFGSRPLGRWLLENCGKGAQDKRIPKQILYNTNLDILSSFIRSYIEGDGCVGTKMINFGTVSKVLALQMQLACARFGILFNLHQRKPCKSMINEKIIDGGILYHGYSGFKKAFELIGKETSAIRSTRHFGLIDTAVLTPVTKVSREHFSGTVYNMETDCHTYSAGNIITHNCVYNHIFRRGRRNKDLWNYAADAIVNYTLMTAKDNHGGMIGRPIRNVPPVDDIIFDEDLSDDFSVEEIYALLEKNAIVVKIPLDMHLDGENDETDDSEGSEGVSGDGMDGEQDDADDGSKGPPRLSEEEIEAIRDNVRATLIQASQQPNVDPGKIPAGIRRMLKRLTEPKIDWRQMLDNVLRSSIKHDYSYMRVSRRFYSTGFVLPGQDVMEKVSAIAFLDGSGSTTQEMVTDFLSECKGIMDTFQDFELTIATFDTKVYEVITYTPDNADEIHQYPFKGGGGTMPSCCWNYMKEHELEPHKILLFTDGEVGNDWGDENFCVDTLFIVHSNPRKIAPWGMTTHFEFKP